MSKSRKVFFTISIILNVIGLGFVVNKAYFIYTNQPFTDLYYYQLKRQTIYDLLPVKNSAIVFAGDSHIQYYDLQEFFPEYETINRGIAGDYTAGLINRMDSFLKGQPKEIVFEVGFNDLWHGEKVDSIVNNYRIIINKVKAKSLAIKIVFVSVLPSDANIKNVRAKPLIIALNDGLLHLCKTNNIPYVDVYSKLSDKGALNAQYNGGDGIHLNGEGYVVFTKELKPYLIKTN